MNKEKPLTILDLARAIVDGTPVHYDDLAKAERWMSRLNKEDALKLNEIWYFVRQFIDDEDIIRRDNIYKNSKIENIRSLICDLDDLPQ